MDSDREAIGLIGVGLVGSALAEHMLRHGFRVLGYDIDPARMAWLRAAGGDCADGPRHVGCCCRRVVLSLMTTQTVEQVLEGPGSVTAQGTRVDTVIDTSTGDPGLVVPLAARLGERGIRYVEAPLSGSSTQIRRREALLLAAGEPAAIEACRDVLSAFSEQMLVVGPVGNGARAKLASNLVLGLNRLVLAEGLTFARALGLDLDQFLDILRRSPACSAAVDTKGERMVRGNFAPESRVKQHRKDVVTMLDCAAQAGLDLPLSKVHLRLLDALIESGDGDLDTAAVIRAFGRA